jgi:hypothetical protein
MKLALWRLGSGLIALPAQVISLFLVFHGAGEAVGDLYRRLLPPGPARGRAREGAALFGLLLLGIPVAVAMSGAALVMIFTLGRMVWYPFWALSAPADELRRSWGGPTPLGATVVHWLVGVLVLVAGDLILRGGGYLVRRLVFPPLREDQPAPLRPPGSARRASGTATRPGTPRTR